MRLTVDMGRRAGSSRPSCLAYQQSRAKPRSPHISKQIKLRSVSSLLFDWSFASVVVAWDLQCNACLAPAQRSRVRGAPKRCEEKVHLCGRREDVVHIRIDTVVVRLYSLPS